MYYGWSKDQRHRLWSIQRSCICENGSRDYYRNPTKPYWYRKYEELIESGNQLEIGAELDVLSETEGASEGNMEDLEKADSERVESDNMEEGDVTENNTEQNEVKSILEHA